MADRRAELERKKQRLAQIREDKRRKREQADEATTKIATQDARSEADEIISLYQIPSAKDIQSSNFSSLGTADVNSLTDSLPSLNSTTVSKASKISGLKVAHVHRSFISPRENVTYNKQTQTQQASTDKEVLTYADLTVEDEGDGHSLEYPSLKHTGPQKVEMIRPANPPESDSLEPKEEQEIKPKKVVELSEEEKMQIMMQEEFFHFFDRTTRIVERALDEDDSCLFLDYSGNREEQEGEDKRSKLSLSRIFYDERLTKNKAITSFDWSTQFPELLLTSYNCVDETPNDPEGVCLIWNMRFKRNTPEFVFNCQSQVTSACFAKFHPNLIIGGLYSGQIVLWDNRSSKKTPVQRSPLSAIAHTHPVYSVQVVGTQNAHNLVSVSMDGKFCTWSLENLSAPTETMELNNQKVGGSIAATCLSFPQGDSNNFVVGSEQDLIYSACRHGSKAGIMDIFDCHKGPVTGIDCHRAQGPLDFSHLFVSSSYDWTIKLWSLKETKPLYSFENNGDYVYNVKWSPIHPAMFASVDAMGRLDIWNLNKDTELPIMSTTLEGNPSLNSVTWTPQGNQVAIGDYMGKIWVYDIDKLMAIPHADEWSNFADTLQEIQNNQAGDEMDELKVLLH